MCSPISDTKGKQTRPHQRLPTIHFLKVGILSLRVNWRSKMAQNSDSHASHAVSDLWRWDRPPMTQHKTPQTESSWSDSGNRVVSWILFLKNAVWCQGKQVEIAYTNIHLGVSAYIRLDVKNHIADHGHKPYHLMCNSNPNRLGILHSLFAPIVKTEY